MRDLRFHSDAAVRFESLDISIARSLVGKQVPDVSKDRSAFAFKVKLFSSTTWLAR